LVQGFQERLGIELVGWIADHALREHVYGVVELALGGAAVAVFEALLQTAALVRWDGLSSVAHGCHGMIGFDLPRDEPDGAKGLNRIAPPDWPILTASQAENNVTVASSGPCPRERGHGTERPLHVTNAS
jgi:hypothetical protein